MTLTTHPKRGILISYYPDKQMIRGASQPDGFLSWMDSLADPTRLRLLCLIEQHELGVAELCDILQLPQSTVSRHLKVLNDQGWVRGRRHGTTNLYRSIQDEVEPTARRLWSLTREQTDRWATVRQDNLRLTRRLQQRREDSQSFFAGAAAQWDKLRVELYGSAFTQAALMALLPSDWVVADLGCGTGQCTFDLAANVAQVIAVDQSAAMLKAARRRTDGLDNVELLRGDLDAVPIEDGRCDAALLLLVLTYMPSVDAVLAEAARVLKPGGKLVVVDLMRHDRDDFRRQMGQRCMGFEPDELERRLLASGLQAARVRPLPAQRGVKGPALMLATAMSPEGQS
jgi:ubiquinone/menaquinone biosynthesis C-methylase UbiE/DNA-binding transcriptional ArsR family regulator